MTGLGPSTLNGLIGPAALCEDPLSGPDLGPCGAVDPGPVPSVSAFQATDPALAAGSPLHLPAERRPVFLDLSGLARFALAGNDNMSDCLVVQGVINARLAVAAVGRNGPGFASGAGADPFDGRGELGRVSGVALVQGVVQDDPVVVVDHLRLVAELHGLAELSLGDGPGIGVQNSWCATNAERGLSM